MSVTENGFLLLFIIAGMSLMYIWYGPKGA
jgi:hypothetical protein